MVLVNDNKWLIVSDKEARERPHRLLGCEFQVNHVLHHHMEKLFIGSDYCNQRARGYFDFCSGEGKQFRVEGRPGYCILACEYDGSGMLAFIGYLEKLTGLKISVTDTEKSVFSLS